MPDAWPRLLAITDRELLPDAALVSRLSQLCRAAAAGTVAVLLRDHGSSARVRLELGRTLRSLTRDTGQSLWIADRLELALLLEADAVHLGESSVSARDARAMLPPGLPISRAWHGSQVSEEQLAELQGVDALLLSPLLQPRKRRPALGLAALGQLARSLEARGLSARVYALGGVTAREARACRDAGAWGVAAIGAALRGELEPLLEALELGRS